MEKKILSAVAVKEEFDTLTFQEQVIKIKKRLSLEDVIKLVAIYLEEYYSENENNSQPIFAEYGLKSATFETATDFSISTDDFSVIAGTTLFDDVISKISNFDFVRMLINKSIEKIDKKNSIEISVSKITESIIQAIQNFSEKGIDQDMLNSIQNTIKEVNLLGIKEEMPVKVRKTSSKKDTLKNVQ
jgi:hypothetical protein